jgi:hypothetical protein
VPGNVEGYTGDHAHASKLAEFVGAHRAVAIDQAREERLQQVHRPAQRTEGQAFGRRTAAHHPELGMEFVAFNDLQDEASFVI